MGLVLAAYLYIGIGTPIDEDRALESAFDTSEAGCDDASLLVSLMVNAPVATDRIREPMTEEEVRVYIEYSKVSMNEYGWLCVAQRLYSALARISL